MKYTSVTNVCFTYTNPDDRPSTVTKALNHMYYHMNVLSAAGKRPLLCNSSILKATGALLGYYVLASDKDDVGYCKLYFVQEEGKSND